MSMCPLSFVDVLEQRCSDNPAMIAYTFLEDGEVTENNITYFELQSSVKHIAGYLQQQYKAGDRILLFFEPGIGFIKAFYACLYSGIIAVPSIPPKMNRSSDRLKTIIQDAGANAILTTGKISNMLAFHEVRLTVEKLEDIEGHLHTNWKAFHPVKSDIAFLQYTSGSTGNPKGVVVTHGNIIHNQRLIKEAFHQEIDAVIVGWLPFYHDMGLIGNILHPAYLGARSVLMSPIHFLQKPQRWLEAISRYKGTISGGPNFAFDLCLAKIQKQDVRSLNLSSWEVAFCGAEPVKRSTLLNFSAFFKTSGFRENAFYPCYGMAEATLFISAAEYHDVPKTILDKAYPINDHDGATPDLFKSRELVSCGYPPKDYKIVIVDSQGVEKENGKEGEIWVQGESVARGYWNKEVATSEIFDAYLANGKGPYLKTGDIGVLQDDNLFITGRKKDLIIINGRNYYPHDIESIATRSSNLLILDGCAAFSVDKEGSEKLVIMAEIRLDHTTNYSEVFNVLKKSIFNEFDLPVYDIVFIRKGTLLKTTSGKIRRFACKKAYNEHTINALAQYINHCLEPKSVIDVNITSDERRVLKIFRDLLGNDINPEDDFIANGLDSIKTAQVTILLSEEFNTELSIEIVLQNTTVKLLTTKIIEEGLHPVITLQRCSDQEHYACSPLQKSIWLNQFLNPETNSFNIPTLLKLEDNVDAEALEYALNRLLSRYEILRTSFMYNNSPRQVVNAFQPYKLACHNLDASQTISDYVSERTSIQFDLQQYPLWRAEIVKANDSAYLLFVIHHIIIDGYSLQLIYKELFELIDGFSTGLNPLSSVPDLQFRDYAEWLEKVPESQFYEDEIFWKKRLAGIVANNGLPFNEGSDISVHTGASVELKTSAMLLNSLEKISKELGVSLYTTLLSAFSILLSRLTGNTDLLIGAPVMNREFKEVYYMPGPFVNTIVLRIAVNSNESFKSLMLKNKEIVTSSLAHQSYPFGKLLECLEMPVDKTRFPITSIFFNGLNFFDEDNADTLVEAYSSNTGIDINFDLNCYVSRKSNGINIRFDYRKSILADEKAKSILDKYEKILYEVSTDLEQEIGDVDTIEEVMLPIPLDAAWYQPNLSVTDVIYAQFKEFKDRIAVINNHTFITYGDLNAVTNRWAKTIFKLTKGKCRVAFCVSHNLNMVTSIISILKSGNAYVPLDPNYPQNQLVDMVIESEVSLLITDKENRKLIEKIRDVINITIIDIDNAELIKESDDTDFPAHVSSDDLLYILYTSGSSGKAKGVKQLHKGLLHFISNYTAILNIDATDRFTGFSSCCYDSFSNDFFGALLNGAAYCPYSILDDPDETHLINWIEKTRITVWQSIPSLFKIYSVAWRHHTSALKSLRIVKMTGEAVRKDHFERYLEVTDAKCKFVVSLGSTESSLHCINLYDHGSFLKNSILPVGFPINRTKISIVNEKLHPLGMLEIGEILVESNFISPGYINDVAENKSSFLDRQGIRGYLTGDLGRQLPDGRIEWISRKGGYIKMNGIRIYPPAIEYVLLNFSGIHEAVVLVLPDSNGEVELVAYIVSDESVDFSNLRSYLKDSLPGYMIPGRFIRLDHFPTTLTGKIDKIRLSELMGSVTYRITPFVAAESETEKKLVLIWKELLNVSEIGVHDNFFDLGGQSIKIMQLISRVSREFQIQLNIQSIFKNPTIRNISEQILFVSNQNKLKNNKALLKEIDI